MSPPINPPTGPLGAEPNGPIVSLFDNAYDADNPGQWSLVDVLASIRDGACAAKISVIRAVLNDEAESPETQANLVDHLDYVSSIPKKSDEQASFLALRYRYNADPHSETNRIGLATWLKKGLPGGLFAGQFSKRGKTALQKHSGLICIDIDDILNPYDKRDEIGSDPHCVAAFVSPSETGLKIVLKVPRTDAKGHTIRIFPAAAAYLSKNYGVMADVAARDVSRLCFLSSDPDIKINLNAIELVIPETGFEISASGCSPSATGGMPLSPGDDYNARGDVPALLRKHDWTSSDDVYWTRPGKESGNSASLGVTPGPPRSFWVFSSNAAPFAVETRYEPWRIFSMLECNGDDAAAFTKLHALGYGAFGSLPGASDIIILPSMDQTYSASARTIFTRIATSLTMFSRGGVVHEVISDAKGSRLAIMAPTAFRSRLEKYGRLMALRADRSGKKLIPTNCPEETAAGLLVTTEAHDLLPSIRSVVASPVLALANGGLVVLKRGWNSENGGVFVTGGQVPPEVDLVTATNALLDLLGDFDFQSDGDCSRALAALITPALKAGGLLPDNTPIEACEADKSQSGKGFFFKLLTALYAETPTLIAQKNGGVGSFDESVSSALIAGRPFIQFDNMRGKVASTLLEAVITANGPFQCRAPHRAPFDVDTRPFTFFLTSNGVETTRDLANRCSIIRIRKQPDGYGYKAYPEGGLLAHIKDHQSYYLGCVFAIVREWVAQGCKRTTEHRHDFREWAQTLDWIVTTVIGTVPLMDGHNAARDRISDADRSWLRAIALKLAEDGRLGCAHKAAELAELSAENDIPLPNVRSDSTEDNGPALAVGRALGKLFNGNSSVSVDNYLVTRTQCFSATTSKPVWHYSFMLN